MPVCSVVSDSVWPHRRQPTRLRHPWDSPDKNTGVVAISFSNAWKWKVKVKSPSRVQLSATPWIVAYQAPPSMGFSRQEYWSGVPLPSPQQQSIQYLINVQKTILLTPQENFEIFFTWIQIPAPTLISYVSLSKLCNLSQPLFPSLWNGNILVPHRWFQVLNEKIHVKRLAK